MSVRALSLLVAALALGSCVRYLEKEAERSDAYAPRLDGAADAAPPPDTSPDGPPDTSPALDKAAPKPDKAGPAPDTAPKPDTGGGLVKYVQSTTATPASATCPPGHVATSGGTLCALNSFITTSMPVTKMNGWVSTCTGAVSATYVTCVPTSAISKMFITPSQVSAGANAYFGSGCLSGGLWEVGGGCSCGAGSLVATTGPASLTLGADPRWRCACSAAGTHTAAAICIQGSDLVALGGTRSKNQGSSVSVMTSSCKGGKTIIGGGCQHSSAAPGQLRFSKPQPTSWSCGFGNTASHVAERYCVNPGP